MIGGPERFLQMRCAVLAYRNQAVGKTPAANTPHAVETLANRLSDRPRHAFSGQSREFPRQAMSFFILDVKAHDKPFYHKMLPILP
jgi:hypothetical protein